MADVNFASQVMDTMNQRVQERIAKSNQMDQELRSSQTQALLNSIYAVDENGQPKLSPAEADDAWSRIEQIHKPNKGAQPIIDKARAIGSKLGGLLGHPNAAMGQRAAQQTGNALNGGQGGSLVAPSQPTQPQPDASQPTVAGAQPLTATAQAAPAQPYTPPPPAKKLPVQQVAAQAPASPTPPPARSTGSLIQAGSPNVEEANKLKMQAANAQKVEEMKATAAVSAKKITAQSKLLSDLASKQLAPVYDTEGELTGSRPMTTEELSAYQKGQTSLVQGKADTEKHKQDLEDARGTLAKAQADYNEAHAKSLTDPNTPMNQKILEQLKLAQRRMTLAEVNTGIRNKNYLGRYYGTDEQGNPLPGSVADESGLPVGSAFARFYAPTAATLTKAQSAPQIESMANHMISFAGNPANEQVFGKEGGLRAWASGKIGTNDPRLSGIGADIESLSSFLTTLHGARGRLMADGFKNTLRNFDSPEAFSNAVREYASAASTLEAAAKPNEATQNNPSVGGGAQPTRKPGYGPIEDVTVNGKTIKARRNLETGKYLPE